MHRSIKKKTVKNEHTEQQINQNKATKKEAIKTWLLQKNRLKNTCLIGVKLQLNIVRNNL